MIRGLLAAAILAVSALAASASTIDFKIGGGSTVHLSDKDRGLVCFFDNCDAQANIASGLAGSTFSLGEGEWTEIDFITFTGSNSGGLNFKINATLDFATPAGATTTGSGTGGAILVGGFIVGGVLHWDTGVPNHVTLADGSKIVIDFEDGITLFEHSPVTTSAKIKVKKIVEPAPVPLPAGGLLLIGGLGAFGVARLRKTA